MLSKLSAAQLAKVFNAVTDRKPVKKFESKARAVALTRKELDRMHVPATIALARAGFPVPAEEPALLPCGRSERFVRTAVDAVSGEPVALRSLHGPVRAVEGDPEKAARKVASASVVQLRTVRQAKAAAAVDKAAEKPAMRGGARRTAATMGPVIAALRSAEGATLAECTALAGWDAPFELRNLHIAARKRGAAIVKLADGAYRLTGGE